MARIKKSETLKQKKSDIMEKPVWLKYTKEEVEAIILKLSNKGMTSEKIGLALRDQYGIPKVKIYGIKIKKVIESKSKYEEPTVINLKNRVERITSHYQKNKGDKKAERSMIIVKAQLKKREEYHSKKLRLE